MKIAFSTCLWDGTHEDSTFVYGMAHMKIAYFCFNDHNGISLWNRPTW